MKKTRRSKKQKELTTALCEAIYDQNLEEVKNLIDQVNDIDAEREPGFLQPPSNSMRRRECRNLGVDIVTRSRR